MGQAEANLASTTTGLASPAAEGRTTGPNEEASGHARQVFDNGAPGGAAPPVTAGSVAPSAGVLQLTSHIPPGALGDPAIQTGVAWFARLDSEKDQTRASLAGVKRSMQLQSALPSGDLSILKVQKAQLDNQLKQLEADQKKAQQAIKKRLVSLKQPWIESPPGGAGGK